MSTTEPRPTIEPNYLADLVQAAPARVRKKIDANPTLAQDWDWSVTGETLTVTNNETVSGAIRNGQVHDLNCTCLLSPRCLHALGVASLLPLAESAEEDGATNTVGADASEQASTSVDAHDSDRSGIEAGQPLPAAAHAVAAQAWEMGGAILATGVSSVDSLGVASLLRVAHLARAEQLYRLDAALVRVIDGIRAQRSGEANFALANYSNNLVELLQVARRLGGHLAEPSVVNAEALGVGRRAYERIGSLTLFGLFTEAVATDSGFAGVVTYLADTEGRIWTVSDIRPGEVERCQPSYRAAVDIAPIDHHQLGRSKIFTQGSTASASGRLGAGKSVQAVVSGQVSWFEPELEPQWSTPLDQQLERALVPRAPDSGEGHRLLFLQGSLIGGIDGQGTGHRYLMLDAGDDGHIRLEAPEGQARLESDENLRLLFEADGLEVRVIGRPHPTRPRCVSLLALASHALRSETWPSSWAQHINLSLDRLQPQHVRPGSEERSEMDTHRDRQSHEETGGPLTPALSSPLIQADQPLRELGTIVERTALAGRQALSSGASRSLRIASRGLEADMMATGAGLITELAEAGRERITTALGARIAPAPNRLATAWLGAATYRSHVEAAIRRTSWDR